MTTYLDMEFSAANAEVSNITNNMYVRVRSPLDGTSAFGDWVFFNHESHSIPDEVEVSLANGEILLQVKDTQLNVGRCQLDPTEPASTTYMETKTVRIPESVRPKTTYGPTWYSFNEYRLERNWLNELDTQFQVNLVNPSGTDYLLFSPTINHYNLSTEQYDNRWSATPQVQAPIDETFEVMQLIRAGINDGRWLYKVKFQGEPWQTLFDYKGRTIHPDGSSGVFRVINPLKVYTNPTFIFWMAANNGTPALACSRIQAWA